MTGGRPECSIVVWAFNEERHPDRLFDGIEQQTVRDVEVVVVAPGSTDATPAIAVASAHVYPVHSDWLEWAWTKEETG